MGDDRDDVISAISDLAERLVRDELEARDADIVNRVEDARANNNLELLTYALVQRAAVLATAISKAGIELDAPGGFLEDSEYRERLLALVAQRSHIDSALLRDIADVFYECGQGTAAMLLDSVADDLNSQTTNTGPPS